MKFVSSKVIAANTCLLFPYFSSSTTNVPPNFSARLLLFSPTFSQLGLLLFPPSIPPSIFFIFCSFVYPDYLLSTGKTRSAWLHTSTWMNVLVKCDMSASSLESYVWIAAVDAVGGASSSEVGGVSSLDASENCTICGANRSVSVVFSCAVTCVYGARANVGLVYSWMGVYGGESRRSSVGV